MTRRLLLLLILLPTVVLAGQDTDGNNQTQTGPLNVAVDLDYELRIPAVLFFRVGSPGTVVDTVSFDLGQSIPPSSNAPYTTSPIPGDGSPIAATSNGVLPVEVRANSGVVSISATVSNPNGLGNGLGQFIPFDDIDVSSDSGDLPAPEVTNAGAAPVVVTANLFGGRVTDQTANWTFTYANTTPAAAGTYTGTITYIASVP